MRYIQGILVIGLVCFVHISTAENVKLSCTSAVSGIKLSDMVSECTQKMREQVQVELTASMTYLSMGAYFSKDVVNRPGFAKVFFESAKEERDHAIKIISYLLMRGELTTDVAKLIDNPKPAEAALNGLATNEPGLEALKAALQLEKNVTKSIRSIIQTCESPESTEASKKPEAGKSEKKRNGKQLDDLESNKNDYHLVDYLTGDFLEEQYNGQREIAGRIETLAKLTGAHGYELGEFLFDKKLLNGEPM